MMNMINANFTKQENQNVSAGDPPEKDVKPDEFMQLLAGLCHVPPDPATPVKPPVKPVEDAATAGCAEIIKAETIKAETVKNATEENPAFQKPPENAFIAQDALSGTEVPRPDGLLQPPQPNADPAESILPPDVKSSEAEQPVTNSGGETELAGGPNGNIKFVPSVTSDVKPIVKDLKPRLNTLPEPAGPIAGANNFAAMTKIKTAAVNQFAGVRAQVQLETGTSQTQSDLAGQAATHFDHNYVADPDRLAADAKNWSPRKLSKLISEVTDIVANGKAPVSGSEFAAQMERPALPKISVMLQQQIEPKMMALAAATPLGGKQIMKMRLHPAELGTVEIRLERNDAGVLDAHFKTDNDAARDLLTKSLDQLRESLQNAGWQIGRMEISSSPFSQGDGQNQKDARDGSETFSQAAGAAGFERSSNTADDPSWQSGDRLVSLRA